MKTLTKEEILNDYGCPEIPFNEQVIMNYPAILEAMQEFADQENARLTAINEKQAEYIKHLKIQLKMKKPAIGTTSYHYESELAFLQSGEKEPANCIHFSEDQGRNHCCTDKVPGNKCIGTNCGHFEEKGKEEFKVTDMRNNSDES
jgi:hypothetical protein